MNKQWELVWSDEFDGPEGSAPDSSKWIHEIGDNGWGNHEWQYYTELRENSYLDGGGRLVIKAVKMPDGDKSYTSARMKTESLFSLQYGKVEARIKLPYGQGIWPALWMLGTNHEQVGWPDCGEIDIMENIGKEPSTIHGTVHGTGYCGADGIGSSFSLPDGSYFKDDFHVFSVEWEETQIRWYVDGTLYFRLNKYELTGGRKWVFDHPFFLIMNVAVGGDWPGYPDDTTTFPQCMTIDYVRVYKSAG